MAEENGRILRVVLTVPGGPDMSPTQFLGIFELADALTRAIVEHEALLLFEELDLPSEWRLATLQSVRQQGRRVPAPSEIAAVRRGSWEVETVLLGAAVLWFLRSYIHPVVQDAWNDSRVRQVIVEFLRDRIFRGAQRVVERKAIEHPRYRGLAITRVETMGPGLGPESSIRVVMEQQEVIDVRLSDPELIDEFLGKIRG